MENEYLIHYGVKGMKWGVRKERPIPETRTVKTKYGETLTLRRDEGGRLAKALRRVSKTIREEADKTYNYDVLSGDKKVGTFQMYQKSNGEMNVTWGDTEKAYRGRGYMQACMSAGEKIAKELGNVKITGELVGNSPDIFTAANHRGWVKVGEDRSKAVMVTWGGLTLVEKKL